MKLKTTKQEKLRMKKQTKSNLQNPLQSLGIIFLMLFAMAFACKDDRETDSMPDKNGREKTTTGGRCSTENDFRRAITHVYVEQDKREKKKPEVIFSSFRVGSSLSKRIIVDNRYVDVTAYPLKVGFTFRKFVPDYPSGFNQYEYDHENVTFFCYINPKVEWENDETGCVCKGEGRESFEAVQRRNCKYDGEGQAKNCPPQ